MDGDRIDDVSFVGSGLRDLEGVGVDHDDEREGKDARRSVGAVRALSRSGDGRADGAAGRSARSAQLAAFSGVSRFPVRVKCASLAWHALRAALRGDGDAVTTERQ